MKKSFSESPVGKFLLGKGFYAALAVCVLGAGAAAWVIVDKTIDSFTAEPPAASGTTLQNDRGLRSIFRSLRGIRAGCHFAKLRRLFLYASR